MSVSWLALLAGVVSQALRDAARGGNLAAEFKAQRVWDSKQAVYRRALSKHPASQWERFVAMAGGVDYFFGIGSVANYITENFSKSTGSRSGKVNISVGNALRYVKAKYVCKRDGRKMQPGDIFIIETPGGGGYGTGGD